MRPARLRAAHFARPLYVLAAAYLARTSADTDVDALGETELLRELLAEHEALHWDRWDKRRGLRLDPEDQRAAVAVATLLTAHGEAEALTVARLIPHLGGEPETRLIAIARWLAQLYPPAAKAASWSSHRSNRTGSARFWSATCSASTRPARRRLRRRLGPPAHPGTHRRGPDRAGRPGRP